jgi:hypothetical protein
VGKPQFASTYTEWASLSRQKISAQWSPAARQEQEGALQIIAKAIALVQRLAYISDGKDGLRHASRSCQAAQNSP